jgi:hypothetical protein
VKDAIKASKKSMMKHHFYLWTRAAEKQKMFRSQKQNRESARRLGCGKTGRFLINQEIN